MPRAFSGPSVKMATSCDWAWSVWAAATPGKLSANNSNTRATAAAFSSLAAQMLETRQLLFNRNALGQVTGLVDITLELQGNLEGEQLQGQHHQKGREQLVGFGHPQHLVGYFGYLIIAVHGHGNHLAIPGLDLFHAVNHLLAQTAVGNQEHTRGLLVDQGDRPVLNLGGAVAFGMDVTNLLQLQGPFQGYRIQQAAAKKKEVLMLGVAPGNFPYLFGALHGLLYQGGDSVQLGDKGVPLLEGVVAHTGQQQGKQVIHSYLTGKGLGGGHGNLRAGVDVHPA